MLIRKVTKESERIEIGGTTVRMFWVPLTPGAKPVPMMMVGVPEGQEVRIGDARVTMRKIDDPMGERTACKFEIDAPRTIEVRHTQSPPSAPLA